MGISKKRENPQVMRKVKMMKVKIQMGVHRMMTIPLLPPVARKYLDFTSWFDSPSTMIY